MVISFEEFVQPIYAMADNMRASYPALRVGQSIFNATETIYGNIARKVQFEWNTDCFYDDSKINAFLNASYQEYKNQKNTEDVNFVNFEVR